MMHRPVCSRVAREGGGNFWEEADALGVEDVYFNKGEHPGDNAMVYRKEALKELREALTTRYKIVVRQDRDYDTSATSDPEGARRIIEQARGEDPAI